VCVVGQSFPSLPHHIPKGIEVNTATILIGDVRKRLAEIPDQSVQTCITSPPYWGLRDYGTASWNDGDENCDHVADPSKTKKFGNESFNDNRPSREATKTNGYFFNNMCEKCGARRIDWQVGLEQTPDAFVEKLVEVFREVRRVLKDDGTLWLNLGDSYAGSGRDVEGNIAKGRTYRTMQDKTGFITPNGLKPKDLVGIPWRVAFALQADGWWLRQDIIWHKPNPMPESVTDRCTKAHEYLFLLSKSNKYHFDNEAIKEPSSSLGETKIRFGGSKYGDSQDPKHATKSGNEYTDNGKRNRRSVWTITTKPFKGAHFAVMPEALVEPCVLAGSREDDIVLDPFTGAATVAVLALRHGRNFIGTELNADYVKIASERIESEGQLFNELIIK
jgi:DNA modification methylase